MKKNSAAATIAMLSFGWLAIWVYRTVLSPAYSSIAGELGITSSAMLGLISSCYFLGYVAVQVPGGFLIDRFGRRRVLLPGFGLFLLGSLVVCSAGSLFTLYLGSTIAGLGTGVYYAGAFSLSAERIPAGSRTLSTALVNSGSAVGMVLGYSISSLLVGSLGLSWRVPVAVAAVAAAAATAFLAAGLDSAPPKGARERADLRRILSGYADYVLYLVYCRFGVCRRKIDLVYDRNDFKIMIYREICVCKCLRLYALRCINDKYRTLAGRETPRYLVVEIDMSGCVYEIEDIVLAVLRAVIHLCGIELNCDTALALYVHGI